MQRNSHKGHAAKEKRVRETERERERKCIQNYRTLDNGNISVMVDVNGNNSYELYINDAWDGSILYDIGSTHTHTLSSIPQTKRPFYESFMIVP